MPETIDYKRSNVLAILSALSTRGVTGTLHFERKPPDGRDIDFLFLGGMLLYATTKEKGRRLGEFLILRGVLTLEQVQQGLIEAKKQGALFHSYLLDEDLVTKDQMQELLYQRTEELIGEILKAEDGQFLFYRDQPAELDMLAPNVDEELFGRLLRYRKVWPRVYDKFRDGRLCLRMNPDAKRSPLYAKLGQVERRLLRLLDGTRPVSTILAGRKNRLDIMVVLARFLQSKLVVVVAGHEPVKAEPPTVGSVAVSLPSSPAQSVVRILGASAPSSKPDSAPGSAASEDSGVYTIPELEDDAPFLTAETVPVMAEGVFLEQISLTGFAMDDLFLVSQIDGQSSIRELCLVTGQTQERVMKLVEGLHAKGYVALARRSPASPRVTPVAKKKGAAKSEKVGGPKKEACGESGKAKLKGATGESPDKDGANGATEKLDSPKMSKKERAKGFYYRAIQEYNGGMCLDAEASMRKALGLAPTVARYHARLAVILLSRPGGTKRAEREAEKAMDLDPLDSICLEALAWVKLRRGAFSEARRLLEQALFLGREQVPSAPRLIERIRKHKPKRREAPDTLWKQMRRDLILEP